MSTCNTGTNFQFRCKFTTQSRCKTCVSCINYVRIKAQHGDQGEQPPEETQERIIKVLPACPEREGHTCIECMPVEQLTTVNKKSEGLPNKIKNETSVTLKQNRYV